MSVDSDTKLWGNPTHSTFAKRFMRLVAVDEARIKVHLVLVPIVEKVLKDLSVQDLTVETVEGYPVSPLGQGVVLVLKAVPVESVEIAMAGYGFEPDPFLENHYVWASTYAAALEVGGATDNDTPDPEDASAEPVTPVVSAVAVPVENMRDREDWNDDLPGSRELENGVEYAGRDVLFLQAYLQATRTGIYDAETVAAVSQFKAKKGGLTPDGSVDFDMWKQFLPHMRRRVQLGDSGRIVRVVGAAMIAGGFVLAPDERVPASYDGPLARRVRQWQRESDARPTGDIRSMEWSQLLAHPW